MTELHDAEAAATRDPYRVVLEVGTTLASSLDLDEVVQTIARQVGEALDVQLCDINEYDAEARTMTYVAVWSRQLHGVDLDYLGNVVSLDDRPERDAVIRKGDLLETYVDDEDLDPLEREVMIRYNEKAVMEMPLTFAGEALGVLGVVESRPDRRFTEEEKELFRLLARPAATAIGNARLFRQQREQARCLSTLLDASRALASSVDLDEVLPGLARLATEAVDASYATVYEYRPHHDALVYRAEHSPGPSPAGVRDDALGTVYALDDWPGERAILEASRAVQEHISDRGLADDRRAAMERWRQKTCLSLPLRSGGDTQGILRLTMTDQERRFTVHELQLLEALAESGGAAIRSARLFRVQEEESKRLLDLFDVSRRLVSTLDRRAVVNALKEGAEKLVDGGVAADVWLRDDEGLLAASHPEDAAAGELAQEALAHGGTVERVTSKRSGLAVPLVVKDRVEGVLVVQAEGRRSLSVAEVEALQVLANLTAATLENERLYRRAEQEAVRDGLTGLYNHRHFQQRVRQECRRSQRYGTPLSLLMLDLDDFKAFNDQFGHQIGDEALREVGQILFSVTRRGVDLAARYGGEEFAVILPHTRLSDVPLGAAAGQDDPGAEPPAGAGALVVAERICAAIAGHAFPGHDGRRYARATVTVGAAELRAGEDAASLIAAADAALYEGKRAGGDTAVKRDE